MGPAPPQDALHIEVQAFSKPLAVWSSRQKQREQAWAQRMELLQLKGASRGQQLQECQEMKQRWYLELHREMNPHEFPDAQPFVKRMLAEAKQDRIRYKAEQKALAQQARLCAKQERKRQQQEQKRPSTAPAPASEPTQQQLQHQKDRDNRTCKQKSARGLLSSCFCGPTSTVSDSDESAHSSHSRPRAVSSCTGRSSTNSSINEVERRDSHHSSLEYAGNTGKVPPAAQAPAAALGPAAGPGPCQ